MNAMNDLELATLRIEETLELLTVALVTAPEACSVPINDALMALRMGRAKVFEARKRCTKLVLERVA